MKSRIFSISEVILIFIVIFVALMIINGCDDDDGPSESQPDQIIHPECKKDATSRIDLQTPQSMVADWGQPVRVESPINSLCPEDAIEISGDGRYLYFMFTEDLLESLSPERILAKSNNTYRAERIGGPGQFDTAVYYDLAKGVSASLDGELSFTPDSTKVYFHSNRASNLGYNNTPFIDDYLDIYVADIVNGFPGPGRNLGEPVNSIYPDGEHAIHPDGKTIYFSSLRPGGLGGSDIYRSTLTDTGWTDPVNLGVPVNSIGGDLQPAFTADGDTMYFTSNRGIIGAAIYRSVRSGETWINAELVIRGVVGEASLTADGKYLYFVHVLSDLKGTFDADIWYCERK